MTGSACSIYGTCEGSLHQSPNDIVKLRVGTTPVPSRPPFRGGGFILFRIFWKTFFNMVSEPLQMRLGPVLGPYVGLMLEAFSSFFFALKMRSYLEVVFASIFDRFRTSLEPQKVSSRVGESQILHFLHFLSYVCFGSRFWSPKGSQNRAQEAPKSLRKRTRNLSEVRCRF